MLDKFLLMLLLAASQALPQSETTIARGGLLDPDRTFSDQSVTGTEFRSLLRDVGSDLAQAEKSISAMRPDSLAVEYRRGKDIDDNRRYCTLAVDGTRRLIASVLEKDSLRPEVQLLLSMAALDGSLSDFGSLLSSLSVPDPNNARVVLNWSTEVQGLRKKLLLKIPRIEFYILGRAERLDPPAKK